MDSPEGTIANIYRRSLVTWKAEKVFGYKVHDHDGWIPTSLELLSDGVLAPEAKRLRKYLSSGQGFEDMEMPESFKGELGGTWDSVTVDEKGRMAAIDNAGTVFYTADNKTPMRPIGLAGPVAMTGTDGHRFVGIARFAGDVLYTAGNEVVRKGRGLYPSGVPCRAFDLKSGNSRQINASAIPNRSIQSFAICGERLALGYDSSKEHTARVDIIDISSGRLLASLHSPYATSKGEVKLETRKP